jgi:hypothetical protein
MLSAEILLKEKRLKYVGMLGKNKGDTPKECLWNKQRREILSVFGFQKELFSQSF